MARKAKKTKKRSGGRRRRVSGIMPNKETIMTFAGVVAGIAGSAFAKDALPDDTDPKIANGGIAVAGLLLAGQKNALLRGAGYGLAAIGAYNLVNSLSKDPSKPILPKLGGTPYVLLDRNVAGFNNFPNNPQRNAIAGYNAFPNNPQRNTIAGVNKMAAAGIA